MIIIKRWWSERKTIVIDAFITIAILLDFLLVYYFRDVRGLVWAGWVMLLLENLEGGAERRWKRGDIDKLLVFLSP
jgi:hypothetical protein